MSADWFASLFSNGRQKWGRVDLDRTGGQEELGGVGRPLGGH